jgi:hypothetical protein
LQTQAFPLANPFPLVVEQTKQEVVEPEPMMIELLLQPHALMVAFHFRLADTQLQLKELTFAMVYAEALLQTKQV